MNYNKTLTDEIYKFYQSKKIGYNDTCIACKKASENRKIILKNGPVPIYHIGKYFANAEKKLLIVGLVSYGWDDIIVNFEQSWTEVFDGNQKIIDSLQNRIEDRVEELFKKTKKNEKISTYFNYLNFALSEIYGSTDNAFDNVAITNFVHCNTSETSDNLPQFVRTHCCDIRKNGFIHKEIEILNPTHILCLTTGGKYLRYMKNSSYKYKGISHPSARGRSKEGFKNDILLFLNS